MKNSLFVNLGGGANKVNAVLRLSNFSSLSPLSVF